MRARHFVSVHPFFADGWGVVAARPLEFPRLPARRVQIGSGRLSRIVRP